MQVARKLATVAQLLGRRIEEEMVVEADIGSIITGFARTAAEVSAAMNMTAGRARVLVAQAEALDCRLPAVGALLAAAVVDWYTVEIIIARTELVARHIEDRLFRNRFRRTRVLFHGPIADNPSTSPYCRWVNDPIEPEELPPDWQPPPMTLSDPDEPPPF